MDGSTTQFPVLGTTIDRTTTLADPSVRPSVRPSRFFSEKKLTKLEYVGPTEQNAPPGLQSLFLTNLFDAEQLWTGSRQQNHIK